MMGYPRYEFRCYEGCADEYFSWSPIYYTELNEAIAFVTEEVLPRVSARKEGEIVTVRIMPYGRDETLWEAICRGGVKTMTAQELMTELEKLKDKDLDLYVNVRGREYWISEIAYSDCNEVCFGIKEDFPCGEEDFDLEEG